MGMESLKIDNVLVLTVLVVIYWQKLKRRYPSISDSVFYHDLTLKLITIGVALIGAFLRNADVVSLFLRQFRQLSVKAL